MTNALQQQQGIGLIEVMIAMAIIVFTSLAIGTLQTSAMIAAQGSSVHFSLDHLSNEMLDILRTHPDAADAGSFNFDAQSGDISGAHAEAIGWNERVGQIIATGLGAVDCKDSVCEVTISWMEELDGTEHRQYFLARTPL